MRGDIMSIFPENIEELNENIEETIQQNELPVFKEYAIDFITGELITNEQGENIVLEKKEALKIWIWAVLQVTKNRYKIYSSNYGNELESLISKDYSKELIDSEVTRYMEECLLANPYIKSVENVNVNFEGSKLNIKVKVKTIYGEVETDV